MPRAKKSPAKLLNPDENTEETSASPAVDAATTVRSRREAEKARHVSLSECAKLLNYDRNTLTKYLDQGCPSVERADRDRGIAWVLDVSEVHRWIIDRSVSAVSEKLGAASDGLISEDEAKRRRAVAQAVIAEIEASEVLKTVVPISHVIERVARDYSEIKGRLMTIPDAIAGRVDAAVSHRVREIADEHVRNALKSLRVGGEIGATAASE